MNLTEYLEQDREKLLSLLAAAGTPEKAVPVMEEELDRVLLLYNEQCEISACRDAAAGMLESAKLALPLLTAASDISVWERSEEESRGRRASVWGIALSILAAAALVGGLAVLFLSGFSGAESKDVLLFSVLILTAPILAFFGGRLLFRLGKKEKKKEGAKRYLTESRVDPEKCWRTLKNVLFAADRELEALPERLDEGKGNTEKQEIGKEELELFAGLCEAVWSKDGEYALEKLEGIRYYLHTRGIETEDYDGSNPRHFDFLPAQETATFRPALLKDGEVVKKGLAAR